MIAYLTGPHPVWSQTFIDQELRLLTASDLPLLPVAIAPGPAGRATAPPVHYLSDEPEGAETVPMPWRSWHLPPLRRQLSLLKRRAELQKMCGLVDAHHVTHIHSAFAALPGLLAAEVAKRHNITYSMSVHANDVAQVPFGYDYLFGSAKFVCFCNLRARDLLLSRCPRLNAKTPLIHHGLIPRDWAFRSRALPVDTPPELLFVGRLTPKKQCSLAIEGAHALNCAGIPCRLTILGDGPQKEALMKQWQEQCPELPIRWTGVVTPESVRQHMSRADLLLVTSLDLPDGDTEGIPNVVMEAMAAGLPVAATQCGSIREILSAQTGYLVTENSAWSIVQTVQQMRSDPTDVRQRVTAARSLIEDNFDAEKLITAKIELLREQLA